MDARVHEGLNVGQRAKGATDPRRRHPRALVVVVETVRGTATRHVSSPPHARRVVVARLHARDRSRRINPRSREARARSTRVDDDVGDGGDGGGITGVVSSSSSWSVDDDDDDARARGTAGDGGARRGVRVVDVD